ncbi:NAD(P)-dependent oxidoreductase [Halosimplex rubrum]|uniref:NAD(P)-dependent oxidoreductase n=1 Tax=Halosimplex rubrum TaxID=869889 RepID=A0A7D5T3D5_9EURY|nr:NAD(P)-dependent oxidoreductase [Halosimplex rubrum]QLH76830.1 NAD(P)-dependent oxidoreductase [Halosimplex rubrum]
MSHLSGKRVLVTGGSGVIGQELLQILIDKGAIVRSVDKRPYSGAGVDDVEAVKLDLAEDDLNTVTEFEPEVVFHLAASFERTDESTSFWTDNWADNILASHRLIDALHGLSSLETVVFASSYLVYDSDVYLSPVEPDRPTLIDEQTAIAPRNLCGAAKYYTEKELSFMAESEEDLRVISPRIFRVYGQGSKDIISRWVRAALRGEPITVYNKQNMFDFIHARDVAQGLSRLVSTDAASGPVNLGRGTQCQVSEVISILENEIPGTGENITSDGVKDLYETSCADISRLIDLVNWRPALGIESGIRDVVKYERSRMNDN